MEEKVQDWFLSLTESQRQGVADALVGENEPKIKEMSQVERNQLYVDRGFFKPMQKVTHPKTGRDWESPKIEDSQTRSSSSEGQYQTEPFGTGQKAVSDFNDRLKDFEVDKKGAPIREVKKYIKVEDGFGNQEEKLNPDYTE